VPVSVRSGGGLGGGGGGLGGGGLGGGGCGGGGLGGGGDGGLGGGGGGGGGKTHAWCDAAVAPDARMPAAHGAQPAPRPSRS
jgi:hypothetical protein